MAEPQRLAIFKWRLFTPEVILCAVRWYLRYSLSYRDVQELLVERGLEIDHTTVCFANTRSVVGELLADSICCISSEHKSVSVGYLWGNDCPVE